MSNHKSQNGELVEAVTTAESASVVWVSLRLKEAAQAIGAHRIEARLVDRFVLRFQRVRRRRRLQRLGLGLGSGTGLGVVADSLFDLGWVDWINDLFNWVGRPLLLRLGDSLSVVAVWVA